MPTSSTRPSSIAILLQQAQAGSREAAEELVERYSPVILKLVRRRLPDRLRGLFDSNDFVQEVWADFFVQLTKDRGPQRAEKLVQFLQSMARFKVADASRRHLTCQKRDLHRVVRIDDPEPNLAGKHDQDSAALDGIVTAEAWQRLLAESTPPQRMVLQLARGGLTNCAIGRQLGIDESSVRRMIRRALRRAAQA